MRYTFGNPMDMGRRFIQTPPEQLDDDGENDGWGVQHEDPSIYRRTINVIVSDRIQAGERPLRPRTDAQRADIATNEHDNGWKQTA